MRFLKSYWMYFCAILLAIILAIVLIPGDFGRYKPPAPVNTNGFVWAVPDILKLPATEEGELIKYGRNLVAHTSLYLGPKGKVAAVTNGMNCQNCHLSAGTEFMGNNYSAVYSTYPKFRDRSGKIETIYKRINDCVERSLNGTALDSNSREMKAIYAYIKWLGQNVPRNVKPEGVGIQAIAFMERAADTNNGRLVYVQKCERCHAAHGEGVLNPESTEYLYPPLWGKKSYNVGAGLYRISRFAGYIKHNMPFDMKLNKDVAPLTDTEAWDVSAFVLSQPRPKKPFTKDWPDISRKPFDHPFAPYADDFPEQQHKYGPFGPIIKTKK
ncbi:MAG: c-type cytochrome [Ferruginibacter sp.]